MNVLYYLLIEGMTPEGIARVDDELAQTGAAEDRVAAHAALVARVGGEMRKV